MTISSHKTMPRITLTSGLYLFFGIAVLGLICYNMRDSILGTNLVVTTAHDGSTVTSSFLPITGKARHARELLINGRPIALDRTGAFIDGVLLSPGYNIVEIAVADQFGNKKIKTYQIVVTLPTEVATTTHLPYQ